MWVKRTMVPLMLLLTLWLGGCAANGPFAWDKASPSLQSRSAAPDRRVETASDEPSAGASENNAEPAGSEEVKAFDAAVEMITALQYESAVEQLQPLVERFAAAGLERYAAESLFWLGYCSERLMNPAKAKTYYMRVVYGYPEAPAARQARARLEALGPE